jgi:hypothetical protein
MPSQPNDFSWSLLTSQEPPCLSLYQTTHRDYPSRRQDPIRFRGLVDALATHLEERWPGEDGEALLKPFRELAANQDFWNRGTREGLAVLGSPKFFRSYILRRPVPDMAVVSETFHTKPLLRIVQSADRYQVLALTRDHVRLFEGNRDGLYEVDLDPAVPKTVTEALGAEHTEGYHAVFTYGSGRQGSAMHHGTGSRDDDAKTDAERFFRAVDRAVRERHSLPSHLPLLLASLPEHQSRFRKVSDNPNLIPEGLELDPRLLDPEELCNRAWAAIRPRYVSRLASIVERFGTSKAHDKGTDQATEAARAGVEGRIRTLLIDADRTIPGRLDRSTGRIELSSADSPDPDDLLDELGELVLSKGGEVLVVPSADMPSQTGLAAIYSY